ncbi:MAG: TRAP transporter substrate-binding protein DctP [Deltaproteobacteria bacterium]|jgi:TRAP-type mannitol/chloroaromatic compound transport system substrate-binding protein|nr:TRAP transporter substrate-binding protein DctP [Deltaproteobacteria bacterium]
MKKIRKFLVILSSLVLSLALLAGSASAAAAPIVWKVQGYTAAGTLYDVYGKSLADNINAMSGGRLVIQWYAADSIVPVIEGPTAVRDGILDAVWDYAGLWSSINAGFPLFCASPGKFSDPMDIVGWFYQGGGEALLQEAADNAKLNVKMFLAGVHDGEDFLWSNKPIREIADMKGITLRMMPIMGDILAKNGLSVAFISGTEIVASMERKVVDAGEYSIPALDKTFGFQDVAKYVARPGIHQPSSTQQLAVNKAKWDALPDDLKAIVRAACKNSIVNMLTDATVQNVDALEFFKSRGVTVTQLSDDATKTLLQWIDNYYNQYATEGTLMKKIVDSQNAYIKRVAAYKDSLHMPYPDWAYKK